MLDRLLPCVNHTAGFQITRSLSHFSSYADQAWMFIQPFNGICSCLYMDKRSPKQYDFWKALLCCMHIFARQDLCQLYYFSKSTGIGNRAPDPTRVMCHGKKLQLAAACQMPDAAHISAI